MAKTGDVSQAELTILKALWKSGPCTVRAVAGELSRDWAYTTVQTLLGRLAEKGCVAVDRGQVPHVYRATVTGEEMIRRRLRDVAADLCEGAASTLVMTLVKGERFSKEEIARFRAVLDDMEQRPLGRKKK